MYEKNKVPPSPTWASRHISVDQDSEQNLDLLLCLIHLHRHLKKGFDTYVKSNGYTMACKGDNPQALVSGLSYIQVDKHGITISYHLHPCRPCTSQVISKCGMGTKISHAGSKFIQRDNYQVSSFYLSHPKGSLLLSWKRKI